MLAMYVGFRFFLWFLRSAPQPGCVWIGIHQVPCLQASTALFAVLAKLAEAVASHQVTVDSGRYSTLLVFVAQKRRGGQYEVVRRPQGVCGARPTRFRVWRWH